MIEKLTIQNFQSHKSTELEFSNGVNMICGPTDSGKSAIIRALKWLVWNRPSGDSYRSRWGGNTVVYVDINEDDYVSRVKSENLNMYTLNGAQFKAIKTDVPEEVRQTLNLTEVNLQTQFESHFLLSRSPGEVAAYFNKIAHLDKIDIGIKNIQSSIRSVSNEIKFDEERVVEYQEELKGYNNLPEIENKVEELEQLEDNILGLVGQINAWESFVNEWEEVEQLLIEYHDILSAEKLVNEILELDTDITLLGREEGELLHQVVAIKSVDETLQDIKQNIKEAENLFHKELGEGKVCPLCGTIIRK